MSSRPRTRAWLARRTRQARRSWAEIQRKVSGTPTCEYVGVLDGDSLWLAIRVEHADGATVTLCHRATGQTTTLPTQIQHDVPGATTLSCEVRLLGESGLLSPRSGVFDVRVAVPTDGGDPSTNRVLTDTAAIAPKSPTQTPLSSDGRWSLRPYRTQGGYLALRCDSAPPTCHVDSVTVGLHDIRLRAHLLGTDEPAESLVLRRRRDGETVRLALESGSRVDLALPLEELSRVVGHDEEAWNLYVVNGSEEARIGRPGGDLKNLTGAIRYGTLLYDGPSGRMNIRPYFSLDRFLCLEIKPLETSAS